MRLQHACYSKRLSTLTSVFQYLEGEQAHPSRELEEDAVLDSVASDLRVQHGDQAGQRSRTAAFKHKSE